MVLAHNVDTVKRTQDVHISVDVTFESMLLTNETLAGLKSSGFYKPSPIQLHGIPLGKCGFDLFLEAKSGTGKTAVFTVIALEKLDLCKDLQSIILAPTREIAAQISDVIRQIGSMYKDLNVEVVMGGLPIEEDIKKFEKKVHVLVGSPGRMRHLIQDNHVNVSSVRLLVLDEADKLMDKNFQSDINYIFSVLPKQKQVIMSSATYPETLKSVLQNYVQKAQHICPDSTSILLGIKQLVTMVKSHSNIVRQTQIKFNELIKILSQHDFKQCLIFCNYQIRVVELCRMLLNAKWPAQQLHGQLEQTDRLDALKTLQQYKCRILVSTDLAARGIDASNVDLVINFEPPYEWQTYLHRIGRAGRFGSYGIAITILSEVKEVSKFKEMITSINSSLSLHYVWEDKKFELVDHFDSLKLENDNLEELCRQDASDANEQNQENSKMLLESTDCQKDECDINGFCMLLGSFEKTKQCKIESFNDLLASLENHELSDVKENETGNFNEHPNSILNVKTSQKHEIVDQTNICSDLVSKTESLNDSICVRNQETAHNTLEIKTPVRKSLPDRYIEQEISPTSIDTGTLDIAGSHNALRAAGLPTCFSSKKQSNNSQFNQSRSDNDNAIKQKSDTKCKIFQNINCHGFTSKNICGSFNVHDNNYNTQPALLKPTKIKLSQDQMLAKSSNKNYRHTELSEVDCNPGKMCSDSYAKYMAWYSQIKAHTKQIEMGFYIDELSKI